MPLEIFRPSEHGNKDPDVPDFGNHRPEQLKYPNPRYPKEPQFAEEALRAVSESSLNRCLYFGFGLGNEPHVRFPNAENFQHFPFAADYQETYGNMESEIARIRFMLDHYENRHFPKAYDEICKEILESNNVLSAWGEKHSELSDIGRSVYLTIREEMEENMVPDQYGYKNAKHSAQQSEPIFYEVSEEGGLLERKLWERAVTQISSELANGNEENLFNFLHLYSHIKDPITPITSTLPNQVNVFMNIYQKGLGLLDEEFTPTTDQTHSFIVQTALESSFLALPKADSLDMVVYGECHELPYIYVSVENLPRGEYSDPVRVTEITTDLVNSALKYKKAVGTPITISYMQAPGQKEPKLFIVDGNNRVTALLVMKFIDFVSYNEDKIKNYNQHLSEFTSTYNLDIKCERDVAIGLSALSDDLLNLLIDNNNREIIRSLAQSQFPALLVQETSFHTIAVAQSKQANRVVLLQPMHQSIYNESVMAIPSKKQTHGRVRDNAFQVELRALDYAL